MKVKGGSGDGHRADLSRADQLGRILNARSVAVVGASDDLRKAGGGGAG